MYYLLHRLYTRITLRVIHALSFIAASIYDKSDGKNILPIKKITKENTVSTVDEYWGKHTVRSRGFFTPWQSHKYYQWLIREYPLLDTFMEFNKTRENQVILDYGCGPGNDLYRFLVVNKAQKVIGMDISNKSLGLAAQRLALHGIDPKRVDLIKTNDTITKLPFDDNSFDHINCAGVLQHTSSPEAILKEFYRVIKPGGDINIMVYSQDSIWFHLCTPYVRQIRQKRYINMNTVDAFSRDTDGENCPLARCFKPEEFIAMCNKFGFTSKFMGGYLSIHELTNYNRYRSKALRDSQLDKAHKDFLSQLDNDNKNYPLYKGKYAGTSGVYRLYKN